MLENKKSNTNKTGALHKSSPIVSKEKKKHIYLFIAFNNHFIADIGLPFLRLAS